MSVSYYYYHFCSSESAAMQCRWEPSLLNAAANRSRMCDRLSSRRRSVIDSSQLRPLHWHFPVRQQFRRPPRSLARVSPVGVIPEAPTHLGDRLLSADRLGECSPVDKCIESVEHRPSGDVAGLGSLGGEEIAVSGSLLVEFLYPGRGHFLSEEDRHLSGYIFTPIELHV